MSIYKYDPALDDYVEKDLDELQAEQMPEYTEEDYYRSLGEEAYQEWLNHISGGEK